MFKLLRKLIPVFLLFFYTMPLIIKEFLKFPFIVHHFKYKNKKYSKVFILNK